jgi:hypothetical protein
MSRRQGAARTLEAVCACIGKLLTENSGSRFWSAMRKNLGSKRREIPSAARHLIVSIYADMENSGWSDAQSGRLIPTALRLDLCPVAECD